LGVPFDGHVVFAPGVVGEEGVDEVADVREVGQGDGVLGYVGEVGAFIALEFFLFFNLRYILSFYNLKHLRLVLNFIISSIWKVVSLFFSEGLAHHDSSVIW
jgi:hypothetical protein